MDLKNPSLRRSLLVASRLSLLCAVTLSGTALATVSGQYKSEIGVVRISESDGVITGKLVSKSPCGQKPGTTVLEGTLLDDSITGEIHACQVGPKCSGAVQGLVMLLITRKGRAISGAAHFDTKCKTTLSGDSVSFRQRRQKASQDSQVAAGGKPDDASSKGGTRVATAENKNGRETAGNGRTPTGNDAKGTTSGNDDVKGHGRKGQGAKGKGAKGSGQKGKGAKGKGAKGKGAKGKGAKGKGAQGKGHKGKGRSGRAEQDDSNDARDDAGSNDDSAEGISAEGTLVVHKAVSKKRKAQAVEKARQAAALIGHGKAEEARGLFEEAVELNPSYSQGYNGIGITYYMRDRYDEAKEQYQLALEANPANHDVYYNLACIHALTNEKEQAIGYLQIAFLNGYIDLATLAQDEDLKNLAGDKRFEALKRGDIQ